MTKCTDNTPGNKKCIATSGNMTDCKLCNSSTSCI